jgi:hypothetical protein
MQTSAGYNAVGNALVDRIMALVPANPWLLYLESPWEVLKVPGFDCEDLRPSHFQMCWALARVRHNCLGTR